MIYALESCAGLISRYYISAHLCVFQAATISIEKDWIVRIANNNQALLTRFNTGMSLLVFGGLWFQIFYAFLPTSMHTRLCVCLSVASNRLALQVARALHIRRLPLLFLGQIKFRKVNKTW